MLLSIAHSAIWSSANWKAGMVDLSDLEKATYRVKLSAYLTSLHDRFTFISYKLVITRDQVPWGVPMVISLYVDYFSLHCRWLRKMSIWAIRPGLTPTSISLCMRMLGSNWSNALFLWSRVLQIGQCSLAYFLDNRKPALCGIWFAY